MDIETTYDRTAFSFGMLENGYRHQLIIVGHIIFHRLLGDLICQEKAVGFYDKPHIIIVFCVQVNDEFLHEFRQLQELLCIAEVSAYRRA
jgi:hypothetical protein